MDAARTFPEILEEGTRALVRALGHSDAVRFLNVLSPSRGNHTKERRSVLKNLALDDILSASKKMSAARLKKPTRSSRPSSTKHSRKASSAAKSRGSSPKGSGGVRKGDEEYQEVPTNQLPQWIQQRFKMSQKTLTALSKQRGKNLRVVKGMDMEGL